MSKHQNVNVVKDCKVESAQTVLLPKDFLYHVL